MQPNIDNRTTADDGSMSHSGVVLAPMWASTPSSVPSRLCIPSFDGWSFRTKILSRARRQDCVVRYANNRRVTRAQDQALCINYVIVLPYARPTAMPARSTWFIATGVIRVLRALSDVMNRPNTSNNKHSNRSRTIYVHVGTSRCGPIRRRSCTPSPAATVEEAPGFTRWGPA